MQTSRSFSYSWRAKPLYDYSLCAGIQSVDLPEGRRYPTPAGVFPSITTILSQTGDKTALDAWKLRVGKEEAKRISKAATDRGELIHSYMERYLKIDVHDRETVAAWTDAVFSVMHDPTTERMAQNLRHATRGHLGEVWCQETPLWSRTLRCAGRVDLIGTWHGEPAIIDWKTSNRPKQEAWISDYWCQTAFYALAHNELFGTDIQKLAILITVADGEVQVFEGNTRDHIAPLAERISDFYEQQEELAFAA